MTSPALSPSVRAENIQPRLSLATLLRLPALVHLTSLDAPIVAAVWAWFFSAAAHRPLPWLAPVTLALGVWVLYIVDRLLDVHVIDSRIWDSRIWQKNCPLEERHLEERHRFHARHAGAFMVCIAAACLLLGWLIPERMPIEVRHAYMPLAVLLAFYFLEVHRSPRVLKSFPPKNLSKELAVGLFFAAATAVPIWARAPELHLYLIPAAALFAALCWLNCTAIDSWENDTQEIDSQENKGRRQSATLENKSQPENKIIPRSAITIAIIGVACVIIGYAAKFSPWPTIAPILYPGAACTLSALLLLALHHCRSRISRLTLRVAADAALLTPLLLLPFLS